MGADQGRVEFARVACRVAHLAQQRLVKATEGVNFFGRVEMDAVDQVDYVA